MTPTLLDIYCETTTIPEAKARLQAATQWLRQADAKTNLYLRRNKRGLAAIYADRADRALTAVRRWRTILTALEARDA